MKTYDVVIIGAGATGLMCAIEAGKRGRSVLILDKADKIANKILISGGGRCNFTNLYASPADYISNNPHFCKSALSRYTQWDFIALIEKHHLSWTEKTEGQLFCDQKAGAIVNCLLSECQLANVEIQLEADIEAFKKIGDLFEITSSRGVYQCESTVIATGGPSIPAMGSTDFATQIAKQFSLATFPFQAALVPFIFSQQELDEFIKDLAGISTVVELSAESGQSFKEGILFTHRGISGPAALQLSSYWKEGESINVNLFPDNDLLEWLKVQQQEHPNAEMKTILAYRLAKRLSAMLCEKVILNKPIKTYNSTELEEVVNQLSNWKLSPSGTEGMRTAEVSLGGINTNELSSKTFETKSISGLYFIGESVDVTGHLGGFNFQWAWASGWCAGQYV